MYTNIDEFSILQSATVHAAIAQMEVSRVGIVLVVDSDNRLVGTITDGDVRRAYLANVDFDGPVTLLLAQKSESAFASPITASKDTDPATLLHVLRQNRIRHLPILDHQERLAGMVTVDEFVSNEPLALQALVMAGGVGSRLRPLTETMPKPMLQLGDRPLMEIIIQQLRSAGIERINVAIHHASEKITGHFGDGKDFGVSINYVTEDRPLGTAGALGLMELPTETMLVMNGDILTQLDFQAMIAFHREYHADLTVAVQRHDMQIPYGVLECQGTSVKSVTEKPVMNFLLNAGMYLLEPSVYGFIPAGKPYDMTDLIQRLLDDGRSVLAFPLLESWIDIGDPDEYRRAQVAAKSLRFDK
tara:strand:- start:22990 stop:24066 length:1077 start_codon:yes stop_codon:yes gene_type:complete